MSAMDKSGLVARCRRFTAQGLFGGYDKRGSSVVGSER
jgi:hypothetical protein